MVLKRGRKPRPLEDRFWEKVEKTDGCWYWTGNRGGRGLRYGVFFVSKNPRLRPYAHRFSYELSNGPISDGLQIDHLCEVKLCVRPEHLEAVTPQVNMLRGPTLAARNAAATHCPRGHPYDEANTHVVVSNGGRQCRVCGREAQRRYRAATRL